MNMRAEDLAGLRPIERRILKLQGGLVDGERHSSEELAGRFRRSSQHISRIAELATWKLSHPSTVPEVEAAQLRPIERRVMKLRQDDLTNEDLAARFGRSADHMGRIQQLAQWKLAHQ